MWRCASCGAGMPALLGPRGAIECGHSMFESPVSDHSRIRASARKVPRELPSCAAELQAARPRRLFGAARRPAAKRVSARERGTAGLADRLHRLGGRGGRVARSRGAVSSMAATRCRPNAQVDGKIFSIEHLVEHPPEQWLEQNLRSGAKLGYDPWLHTSEQAERLRKACAGAGAELVAVENNPIDTLWQRPSAPPAGAVSSARTQARRRSCA